MGLFRSIGNFLFGKPKKIDTSKIADTMAPAQALVDKQKVLDKALDNVQVLDQSISINDLAVGVKEVEKIFHNKKLACFNDEIVDAMKACAVFLAARCDGAKDLDGQGYNGLDSRFGKSISEQLIWTPAVQHAAKKMLRKYREQLHRGGLSVEYKSIY